MIPTTGSCECSCAGCGQGYHCGKAQRGCERRLPLPVLPPQASFEELPSVYDEEGWMRLAEELEGAREDLEDLPF